MNKEDLEDLDINKLMEKLWNDRQSWKSYNNLSEIDKIMDSISNLSDQELTELLEKIETTYKTQIRKLKFNSLK